MSSLEEQAERDLARMQAARTERGKPGARRKPENAKAPPSAPAGDPPRPRHSSPACAASANRR